jgi:peptide chain release factor 1
MVLRADTKQPLFQHESGGHRWQRVPPTEKRGRVHTSTVTVAVFEDRELSSVQIRDSDLEIQTTKGSGCGGQKRNKVETAVVVRHIPTGIVVRAENRASQWANKTEALEILSFRILQQKAQKQHGDQNRDRQTQIGSGMRGDKRRTIQQQNNRVTDHVTGKQWRFSDYERGLW